MTLNDALEGQALKPAQLAQRGSLLVLGAAGCLLVAFGHRNGVAVGLAMALFTVIIPSVYLLGRNLQMKLAHAETEKMLLRHTKTFLSTQEPTQWIVAPRKMDEETIAERILAALNTDGRALPVEDFVRFNEAPPPMPRAELVVFDLLPQRHAVRGRFQSRMETIASDLPSAALVPWRDLSKAPRRG